MLIRPPWGIDLPNDRCYRTNILMAGMSVVMWNRARGTRPHDTLFQVDSVLCGDTVLATVSGDAARQTFLASRLLFVKVESLC